MTAYFQILLCKKKTKNKQNNILRCWNPRMQVKRDTFSTGKGRLLWALSIGLYEDDM